MSQHVLIAVVAELLLVSVEQASGSGALHELILDLIRWFVRIRVVSFKGGREHLSELFFTKTVSVRI